MINCENNPFSEFDVKGDYYCLIGRGGLIPCRSFLEIRRRGHTATVSDLLMVMMNPGGSKPTSDPKKRRGFLAPINVDEYDLNIHGRMLASDPRRLNEVLVPAVPDGTQKQVVAIMSRLGLNLARVINLSDVRQAKSLLVGCFLRELSGQEHSIFSPGRASELDRIISSHRGRTVIAYGLDNTLRHQGLEPFALLARQALATQGIHWHCRDGDNSTDCVECRHPWPQKQSLQQIWLDTVTRALNECARCQNIMQQSRAILEMVQPYRCHSNIKERILSTLILN